MKKLSLSFYRGTNVLQIAEELLGKVLVTNLDGEYTSGRIMETEAYVAHIDKASHSFGGRRTNRNEHMYSAGATAYVYICYGMHQMFNVVTNEKEVPDAVLIRAVEPLAGIDIMLKRTTKLKPDYTLTKGPGNVGKALGIFKHHSGLHLLDDEIYIAADGFFIDKNAIGTSVRIGVSGAGDDALLPYRFYVKGNKYVSGKNK